MSKRKSKPKEEVIRGPLILALETATGVSTVAVFEGDILLGSMDFHANKLHARLITVMIDQVLKNLSLAPSDLAAIAVCAGPGSYTGLRVGVSAAKGLAMALDLPLLSVGSMDALAAGVRDIASAIDALIVPMIDARRMEVYCAVFDAEGREIEPTRAQVIEAGAFGNLLSDQKVIFLGDGAAKCAPYLQSPQAIVLGNRLSSAAHMGVVAWAKYQRGEFEDLVTFEPFYLKNYVATKPKNKIL